MRIKRFASISLHFSLIALVACSQSGSPLGAADEGAESVPSEQREAFASVETSGPEDASADSPEQASTDSPEQALSVVDSVLAGVSSGQSDGSPSPSESAPSTQPQTESAPEAGIPAATPEEPSTASETSNAAKIAIDAGAEPSATAGPDVVSGLPPSQVFLATDFEEEDLSCWNGNRAANGVNRAGCGPYTSIGSAPFALTEGGIARSGRKAIAITYAKNEEAGGANVSLSSDSVNVRAYYYFAPGFDFGQGIKIGRVSSFNTAKQLNDVDIILEVRSAKSSNQCGVTDMRDVGVFFNGAPKGSDWGNATATMAFERGRWYAVEYQVVLNAPGKSDGVVRLWVDGKLVAERLNLPIRGSLGADAKLNVVKVGGWYSNGGNGNSCANPSQPSMVHMDDVVIANSYIGE